MVEESFILRANSQPRSSEINMRIEISPHFASCLTLALTYMLFAEQKLTIKIAYLDVIVVSHCHFSSLRAEA